ncbi:hypothetical protein HIT06_004260 [Escherichia coli]|nr:hypothetical protein [Escherichia coli]EFI9529087.1 hypothetical protein [Escherichia coli]EFK7925350.1 hypothetical protein [Escherichia coli]EFK7980180.1 hypothetical protein [Escherichia coli]
MEHKDFIKKCDVNTINRIIDEHHKLWKRQRFIRLVVLFSITALYPLYPDVQQKLFNRLLSGKKLTLRDEQEIENLCLLKRYSNSN